MGTGKKSMKNQMTTPSRFRLYLILRSFSVVPRSATYCTRVSFFRLQDAKQTVDSPICHRPPPVAFPFFRQQGTIKVWTPRSTTHSSSVSFFRLQDARSRRLLNLRPTPVTLQLTFPRLQDTRYLRFLLGDVALPSTPLAFLSLNRNARNAPRENFRPFALTLTPLAFPF